MWTGGSRFDEFNMAIKINRKLTAKKLVPKLERFFDLSGRKILAIEKSWRSAKGTPVFPAKGQYTTRGCVRFGCTGYLHLAGSSVHGPVAALRALPGLGADWGSRDGKNKGTVDFTPCSAYAGQQASADNGRQRPHLGHGLARL